MQRNPFTNRSMITSGDDFFGRRDVIDALLGRLVYVAKPQCVALVGQRRIGKSSLFRHLGRVIAEKSADTVVAYYDLEAASDLSTESFFKKLLRRLSRGSARNDAESDPDLSAFEHLEEFLEDGQDEGRRYVLMLDEFDTVTLNPAFDASFFGSLRYLTSNFSLAFLTSSYDDLSLLCHTEEVRQSPFFNVFTSIDLSFMDDDELIELLDTLIERGGIPFDAVERAWVLEQGGGFPFFVQIAASAVWEEKKAGRPGVGEASRRRLVEDADPHFRYYRKHFAAEQLQALETLASGGQPTAALLRQLERRSLARVDATGTGKLFSPLFAASTDVGELTATTAVHAQKPVAGQDLRPGLLVADRFMVEQEVGRGGFGRVFRAIDKTLQRPVALKEFLAQATDREAGSASIKAKALKEARAAAQLSHPGIVTVFDVFDWHGRVLIAMEYVEGQTLSKFLRSIGPLPTAQAASLSVATLEALDDAHRHGIIHRDVKPGNVMIDRSGRIRVMDFGLVRRAGIESASTASSGISGTPSYMAPEQLKGEPIDHRVDIFAFGVLMYELVTGKKPFTGETVGELTRQILFVSPTPVGKLVPGIDGRYADVTMRCLAKERDERPATRSLIGTLHDIAGPVADATIDE